MDARVRKFVNEVGHALKVCALPAARDLDQENEPKSDLERVAHLQLAGKAVQLSTGTCNQGEYRGQSCLTCQIGDIR